MAAKHYTRCVAPEDYEGLDYTPEAVIAVLGVLFAFIASPVTLLASLWAVMSALLKICDFLLYGKLVCLGDRREECAIGRVITFETVDDKKGYEKLDNDYSINLLLAPHHPNDFKNGGTKHDRFFTVANDGLQGRLIRQQPGMPIPEEGPNEVGPDKATSDRYNPYMASTYGDKIPYPTSADKPWDVPVFHTEIEGDRTYYVCKALSTLSNPFPFIPGFCKWKPFGIPVGRVVCSFVATILAPLVIAAIVAAWFAGSDDNRDELNAGELAEGDMILVRGIWTYDAGHSGYNEMHPILYLQKLDPSFGFTNTKSFGKVYQTWCRMTGETPPGVPEGEPIPAMTPEQKGTFDSQRRPENRWIIHPWIDGCEPEEEEEEPPVIR